MAISLFPHSERAYCAAASILKETGKAAILTPARGFAIERLERIYAVESGQCHQLGSIVEVRVASVHVPPPDSYSHNEKVQWGHGFSEIDSSSLKRSYFSSQLD